MSKPAILDRMQVLSDPIRSRLLVLLEKAELTVSELCDVLQLPQSTVSRHLKVLGDQGWIHGRRQGTANLYRMIVEELDGLGEARDGGVALVDQADPELLERRIARVDDDIGLEVEHPLEFAHGQIEEQADP